MRTVFCRLALALAAVLLFVPDLGSNQQPGTLSITVHNVGHGDMTEIRSPTGEVTLVDCGDGASATARKALAGVPLRIARFIATHPHDDHIGNFPLLLTRTSLVYDSGLEHDSRAQEGLYHAVTRGVRMQIARRGDRIEIGGGAWLDVLWPPAPLLRGTASDANNNSIVLMLCYRDFRMLLTGDMETEGLDELVASGSDLRCNAVKIPHHGSRGSLHNSFISSLSARWAIASCARDGDPAGHGLPHEDCLRVWRRAGMTVHATGREGSIRITSDGSYHRLEAIP